MAAEYEETGYSPGTPGKLRLDPGGEKPSESTGNANYVKRGRSLLRIVWHVSNRNRAKRGNVVDKGQIFRSLYYRSPFQRSSNICGSSSFVFARISTSSCTTLSTISLSSSTQVVQKRNFLDPVATTRSEISRICNENRDTGRVNVPPIETKLLPASHFVRRCAFIGFRSTSSGNDGAEEPFPTLWNSKSSPTRSSPIRRWRWRSNSRWCASRNVRETIRRRFLVNNVLLMASHVPVRQLIV